MRPTLTTHDSMALLTADAVECPKFDKGYAAFCVALANGLYVGFGKLYLPMKNALHFWKTIFRMQHVLTMSNPLKIANVIVSWVVVNMIDLFTFFAIANKGKSNKAVYKRSSLFAFFAKLYNAMPVFSLGRNKQLAATFTQNVTEVRDFVKRFKAANGQKDFMHIQPLLVGSSVEVAWQLAQKPAFGSYPSQAGEF